MHLVSFLNSLSLFLVLGIIGSPPRGSLSQSLIVLWNLLREDLNSFVHNHSYQLVLAWTFQYFQWQIQHSSLKLLRRWKIESHDYIAGNHDFLWKTPCRNYLLNLEEKAPLASQMSTCCVDFKQGLLMFVAQG